MKPVKNTKRKHSPNESEARCTCCDGALSTHLYNYVSKKYGSYYKQIFPNSPLNKDGKVCQACYVKVKKQKAMISNSESSKGTNTNKKDTYSVTCACCGFKTNRAIGLYKSREHIYKSLFPHSPLCDGESDKVCDACYRKARGKELEGVKCACCEKELTKHSLLYESRAEMYKELFPGSPFNGSDRVCHNCYMRTRPRIKKHYKEEKREAKKRKVVEDDFAASKETNYEENFLSFDEVPVTGKLFDIIEAEEVTAVSIEPFTLDVDKVLEEICLNTHSLV